MLYKRVYSLNISCECCAFCATYSLNGVHCSGSFMCTCRLRSSCQIKYASSLRDTAWLTETVPFGWASRGVWPTSSDGTEVNIMVANSITGASVSTDMFWK